MNLSYCVCVGCERHTNPGCLLVTSARCQCAAAVRVGSRPCKYVPLIRNVQHHPQNGFGNVLPVSAEGCQLACEAADGCDSVSYNVASQLCFLKAGPSSNDCSVRQII